MTPGAKRVLLELAEDEDKDILVEGRLAYVGNRQTTVMVVNELLRLTALDVVDRDDKTQRYTISATGHSLIRRPALEMELLRRFASLRRKPFTIIGDRIRPMSALR